MKVKFYLFLLITLFCSRVKSEGSEIIVLKDNELNKEHFFHGQFQDLLEDKSGNLMLKDILSQHWSSKFKCDAIKVSGNYNIDTYHWVRFTVKNETQKTSGWVAELYEFKTDYFEFYIPDGNGGYIKKTGGDQFDFSNRQYVHKNFVFDLPNLPQYKPQTFYLRVYSGEPFAIIGVVRTQQRFFQYATMEYFFLALFYGVLITIGLYNFLLYLNVRDKAYLFLATYILAFGLYGMTQDGTGFQIFWPDYPVINKYAQHYFPLVIILSIILYAKSFLQTKKTIPLINNWLNVFIVLRSALFILSLLYHHISIYKLIALSDFLTASLIFGIGIYSFFIKKYAPARYYMLAFSFLFVGLFITMIHSLRWIDVGVYLASYAINGGVVLQVFFLSLSVGDRIKMLINEKEHLKDKIKEDLEQKVSERTQELQYKNMQLDSFVYKASHDIKGPLKSIIGLTTVALKDVNDTKAHEYFAHILKSTNRLDTLLHDLLTLTKMQKEVPVEASEIDPEQMIHDIWQSFKNLPETENMNFDISVKKEALLLSDKKLMYSICQNLVENSIKYKDPAKSNSFLKVTLMVNEEGAAITFADNGIGIPENYLDKIFEMFTKVNGYSGGFGLGLHLVKLSLCKIKGTIKVESKEGQGSVFQITVPHLERNLKNLDARSAVI